MLSLQLPSNAALSLRAGTSAHQAVCCSPMHTAQGRIKHTTHTYAGATHAATLHDNKLPC